MVHHSFLQIDYHADRDLLVGRWHGAFSEGKPYVSYSALLGRAAAHGCRFSLLDVRLRNALELALIDWLIKDFAPRLSQHLDGSAFLAYALIPAQLPGAVPIDQLIPPPAYFGDQDCRLQRFGDENEALMRLHKHRQLEAAPR